MAKTSPLTLAQLRRALESGPRAPVYLLLGSDAALRRRAAELLLQGQDTEDPESPGGITYVDGPGSGLQTILDEVKALPLFLPDDVDRVIWVRRFGRLATGGRDCKPFDPELFKAYLRDPVLQTRLVLEAAALDKRKATYKALASHAVVVDCEAPRAESELRRWIDALARSEGLELTPEATVWLVEMVGPNITVLEQELAKAALCVGPDGRIDAAVLQGLAGRSRQHSVFDLTDALVQADTVSAIQLLNRLLDDGEPPLKLLPMIAWVSRQLVLAHDLAASGCSRQEALAGLGGRWNQRPALLKRARGAARQNLERALLACADADEFVKRTRDARVGADRPGPARGCLEALCRQICAA